MGCTQRRPAAEALTKYGRDLVADAEAGKLDPVIGRDEEIRRVIQAPGPRGGRRCHRCGGHPLWICKDVAASKTC